MGIGDENRENRVISIIYCVDQCTPYIKVQTQPYHDAKPDGGFDADLEVPAFFCRFFSSSFNVASSVHLQYREYPWKWNNTRFFALTDKTPEFISIDLSHQFLTVIRRRFLHCITNPPHRLLQKYYGIPYQNRTLFTSLRNVGSPKAPPTLYLILNHVLWHSSENSSDISTLGLWLAVCAAQPDRKREQEYSSIHNIRTYILILLGALRLAVWPSC